MPEERKPFGDHRVSLENRERLSVTGVTDVISFDEECVVCETGMGVLVFKGSGMKVSSLNVGSGELSLVGSVDSMAYESGRDGRKTKQSMFGKIFK
ncbi:MAG: sporulation protein YabP [Clostridiales bacterium]|jgi:sporulation protein YabP|nr:sporulation protein YabP [Clostridiales bacterium]